MKQMFQRLSTKQKRDWIELDKEASEKKREARRRPKHRPHKDFVAISVPEDELKKTNNSAITNKQKKIQGRINSYKVDFRIILYWQCDTVTCQAKKILNPHFRCGTQ